MEEEISKLDELKAEADQLGIKYSPNIGVEKLQAKIDDKMAELETEADESTDEEVNVVEDVELTKDQKVDAKKAALLEIRKQEKENRKPVVVKIQMVDKREASYATSAYFSTGSTAQNIPLDEWVEMPKILVKQAEQAESLVHVEKDGVTVPKMQKKYVVEYKN